MKSQIIARASLGQVVTIIRKNKNWIQVGYNDRDTDEPVIGWVLTRYTELFK
jgi:uncharacterized protein YgiM (DUF1202 family)